MKKVTVFMNKSLNHSLTHFVQTADSFRNEASESNQSLKPQICSEIKHTTVFMNGSLNHSLTQFV